MDTKKGLKTLFIILAFISGQVIAIAPTDDTFVDETRPNPKQQKVYDLLAAITV